MAFLEKDVRQLQNDIRFYKQEAEIKRSMMEPLAKQLLLLQKRMREYEVKNPPKTRVDIYTMCTDSHKDIEQNNLLAKINDAHSYLINHTLKTSQAKYKKDGTTQTTLTGVKNKIVYDYCFGDNRIDEAFTQCRP